MKGAAPKIAAGAASLALALLGAEVALRCAGAPPSGERAALVRPSSFPGRVYELVPGARGTGFGTTVAVNAHGFRGPELPREAPERARIVALGDSVTFGNDLPLEATWPAVLERALRAGGLAADVLNLGLGGYDTLQEVATLEDLGLGFHPAHVVLGYCVNDVGIVSKSLEPLPEDRARAGPFEELRLVQWWRAERRERAQRRALFERNREEAYARAHAAEIDGLEPAFAARVADLRRLLAAAPAADQQLATRRIPARWYASEARLGRLAHAFARLAALGAAHGFGVTVLLVPYLEEDEGIERGLDLVAALAAAQGLAVVDPRTALRAAGLPHLRIRAEDPVHPNAAGHEHLGRALAGPLAAALARREPGE